MPSAQLSTTARTPSQPLCGLWTSHPTLQLLPFFGADRQRVTNSSAWHTREMRPPLVSFPILCYELLTQHTSGVVHKLPADLKRALTSDPKALTAWEDITPLARNEWICWIESAKKAETRSRRIEWGCSSLKEGKRRPCCWPGCAHR